MLRLNRNFLLLPACAALALLSLAPAAAATIVTPTTTTTIGDPPYTISFTLPAFDPSMGTLTAVDVTANISVTGTVTISNPTGGDSGYGGSYNISNVVYGPTGPLTLAFGAPASLGFGDLYPAGNTVLSVLGSGGGTGSVSGSFSSWEGSGTVSLSFDTETMPTTFGGGGEDPSVSSSLDSLMESGAFYVTYTFTPIPEASSANLLAVMAAFGTFFTIRRMVRPRISA